MPELRGVAVRGFAPEHVDMGAFQYKDKVREKARKLRVKEAERKAAEEEAEGAPTMTRQERLQKIKVLPWSKSSRLVKKTEKKTRQENYISRSQAALSPKGSDFSDEEESDMESDVRLLKKLRKGKISKQDFNKEAGWGSDDDDESD